MSELSFAATLYAIGLIVFPYLLLRGESRSLYRRIDVATYFVAATLFILTPHLGIGLDADTAVALLVYTKLFCCAVVFVIALRRAELRDDPALLASFGVIIQLLLFIPASRIEINGDEAYYLTITQSIAEDFDLDLRNQYASSGMKPQLGDPVGDEGELYSRHEPFLSLLMLPGYLLAKKNGAVATIFVFSFLFLRSLLVLLDEEQLSRESRIFTFFGVAFGAPVLFYSMRMWPEVPGAFFLVSALVHLKRDRKRGLFVALAGLALLKLRFVLIAVPLLVLSYRRLSGKRLLALVALFVITIPFMVAYFATGDPLMVHDTTELGTATLGASLRGFFGLLLDGQQGLLFVAPLFFLGVVMSVRARRLPDSLAVGALAAVPYLLLLIPRPEWHGGWSPPLRYITVFSPLLAMAAAYAIDRFASRAVVAIAAIGTAAFAIHGAVRPWRLFHIANGENAAGEYLSELHHSDFSRLFPSFIRVNDAAWVASAGLLVALLFLLLSRRWPSMRVGDSAVAALSLFLALLALAGKAPGRVIHLEDAHVQHAGGALYPHEFTVARFFYVGGWRFSPGTEATFLAREGRSLLRYRSGEPARITLSGRSYDLPVAIHLTEVPVDIARAGRVTLRCERGSVIIDRLTHE